MFIHPSPICICSSPDDFLFFFCLFLCLELSPKLWTALQAYVATPDPSYDWVHMPENDQKGIGFTAYMINMTSQTWLNADLVNKPVWYHTMYVLVPDTINPNFTGNAIQLLANHFNNDDPSQNLFPLDEENMIMAGITCTEMQTVVVVTFQIPNQVLVFAEDPKHVQREEDQTIAWGWYHFLNNPNDTEWLLRLPMTKAAVRAMDTTEAFLLSQKGQVVSKWIITGPSKRGWTSYTTAAVAPTRVIGFIPMVLDAADFNAVAHHQYMSYAGWSFALQDYLDCNITMYFNAPNWPRLLDIVAPITYTSLMTMPKLIIRSVLTPPTHFLFPLFSFSPSFFSPTILLLLLFHPDVDDMLRSKL